jgi:AbrB family looped-hinge helix DNA binding protein
MSIATLTSKGQITIPAGIRAKLRLGEGSRVDFRPEADGTVRLVPMTKTVDEVAGMLLLPFKGEILDADKVTGSIGGVAVSVTAQRCPRALLRGCLFAAVYGLGQGCLARSEVAVTLRMVCG